MTNDELRMALVAEGLRTVGVEFDGSGDSGQINDIVFPCEETHTLPLKTVQASERLVGASWNQNSELKKRYGLATTGPRWDRFTELMYDVLGSCFPGDWINNDGGYGIVWIDLVTGEYVLEGWQRISMSENASAEGSVLNPLVNPDTDMSAYVKSLLA